MIALSRYTSLPAARYSRAAKHPTTLGLVATLERWVERRHQRQALLSLNDALLKDIGLNRSDAWQEGTKPFWRS